ncbi:unnamed protein product [Candidula unifasciata]|uniref:Uncharacterized protein n=1 Tax=Candidula unifasciata TaxID=100452 RepID=A0A8S3YY09_9EUPU|nr:unnamed protein product [Candidula unifasciata]
MSLKTKAAQTSELDLVNEKDGVSTTLKSMLHDYEYRRKIVLWISLPIAMLNQGIVDSQGAAALLDLQLITATDDQISALYITAYNLGYVLGSLLAGLCHGKINSYFLLTVCCVLTGGTNIATPYCSTFLLMFIVRCTVGCFLGVIVCIVNAEHMRIWDTKGESLLQLINCVYALGGVVGPIMAAPFITERDRKKATTSSHQNVTSDSLINNSMIFNNSGRHFVICDNFTNSNSSIDNLINYNRTFDDFINMIKECHNQTEVDKSNLQRSTNVHFAFLIGGLISILVSVPFLITLLTFNKSNSNVQERTDPAIQERKLPLLLTVFLAVLLFLYYLFYCSIEVTFNSYILVFIVKHFENIGTHEAAYILTYYWALFATGRFFSIFTSKYLPARKLLYIHLTMIASALAGLIAGALLNRFDIVTVFSCLMGLSCSATLAAGFSWTEAELMKVTGPISAVILIGASTGPMVVPFVVGHLVEYESDMWFCYSIVAALVLAVSVLAVMMTFNRCYVNRKYGKLVAVLLQEKPQGLPDIVIQKSYL